MSALYAGVMELVDVTDSKSVGSDTVWVRVPPPAPAQKFPPPFRFRLCRKLHSGGNFFAFGPDSLRWIRVRRGRGMWVGALYLSCQEFIKRETGIACLSFWYAPPLPTVKVGRCGGLMEIAREKPAKDFPAHTLFPAKSETLPSPLPPLGKRRKASRIRSTPDVLPVCLPAGEIDRSPTEFPLEILWNL